MEDPNFEDLLIKGSSWTIHENNIRTWKFFDLKVTPFSCGHKDPLKLPKTNISRYGTQALCFKGSVTYSTIPNRYKHIKCLDEFKQQIKNVETDYLYRFILKSMLILYLFCLSWYLLDILL